MKGCRYMDASFIPMSLEPLGHPGAGQTVLYLELGGYKRESLELGSSQTVEFQVSLPEGRWAEPVSCLPPASRSALDLWGGPRSRVPMCGTAS